MTNAARKTQQFQIITLEDTEKEFWKTCSIDKALEYQNDEVIYRFLTLWEVSFAEAQDLFLETKKWLWLCAQPEKQRLGITAPLLIIDEMWHNFILFSHDYAEYCHDCFGHYIHHTPTSHNEKEKYKKQYESSPIDRAAENIQEQIEQYKLIYQKLGVETLLKWYLEYPERYNEEFFKKSYKPTEMDWTPSPEMQKIASLFKAGKLVIRN
jgi:hypothetical protein